MDGEKAFPDTREEQQPAEARIAGAGTSEVIGRTIKELDRTKYVGQRNARLTADSKSSS